MLKRKLQVFFYPIIAFMLVIPNYAMSDTVDKIANRIGVDRETAIIIANGIFSTVRGVQSSISKIADSDISVERKTKENGIIESAINQYFKDESSRIYVSALSNKKNHRAYTVNSYFNHLANLINSKGYNDVKIYFDENLQLANFSTKDGKIYASTKVWQVFKGCGYDFEGRKSCYKDVTQKSINMEINRDLIARITSISVGDTYTFEKGIKQINKFLKF